jgi:hypothetical protein
VEEELQALEAMQDPEGETVDPVRPAAMAAALDPDTVPPADVGDMPNPADSTTIPTDSPEPHGLFDATPSERQPSVQLSGSRAMMEYDPTVPIVFVDMKEFDDAAREQLQDRQYTLETERRGNGNKLPPELEAEYKANRTLLARTGTFDPFYKAVQVTLGAISPPPVGDVVDGMLPSQQQSPVGTLTAAEQALAAVYGLMGADNLKNPQLDRFIPGVSTALGEYTQSRDLFAGVLLVLMEEGNTGTEIDIRADQWAQVVRSLRNDSVTASDPYLPLKTRVALAGAVGSDETAAPSSLNIDLPDLEAQADLEIVSDNLRAMQAIYFAAMLEDVKLFQVVDKLVEFFQTGMLPLGKGRAGDMLYDYWKKSVNRLSEIERRNLYARTLGIAGGDPSVDANKEFKDLFVRFVSASSSFLRQYTVEDLLRATIPVPVSQEQVRKSGRDLAANLSLHGYGVAWFAATELQNTINDIIALLSSPEVKMAFGARDMWQVIDQVATLELGGAKNSVQQRTLATSGSVIIRWLAERAQLLASPSTLTIIDLNQIRNPMPRSSGQKSTTNPTDRDLVDACEQWLAVTGTQDTSVEQYAQPVLAPNVTTVPIQIPQIARDMLNSVGIQPDIVVGAGTNGSSKS